MFPKSVWPEGIDILIYDTSWEPKGPDPPNATMPPPQEIAGGPYDQELLTIGFP